MIVKDEINWDGSDPDDAIVFMVGLENMADSDCAAVLTMEEAAEEFLDRLKEKRHPQHKQAMNDLAKWKNVASASQKEFFKDMVQYLFEHAEAYQRFLAAVQNGFNP